MSKLYSFYVGLGALLPEQRDERVEKTLKQLTRWYGGASAFLGQGCWTDGTKTDLEPCVRFDLIQTDPSIDAARVARWLAKLYDQQEVLSTQSSIQTASYSSFPPLN